jgi:hypothetical protein
MSRHDDHSYNDHDIAWLDDHGASNNHDHVHHVVHDVHVVHHNDGASDNHDRRPAGNPGYGFRKKWVDAPCTIPRCPFLGVATATWPSSSLT